MKHAYLVLSHENPLVLKKLLAALDDYRNDIYLHIDSKADFDGSDLIMRKSELTILSTKLDARWGDFSLVEVELRLLKAAIEKDVYERFHLISGVDYPLKTNDYIHDFFLKHKKIEFIGFSQNVDSAEIEWRSQNYFLFATDFKSNSILKRVIRKVFISLQRAVGYRRNGNMDIKKGPQWWSITDDFAKYILANQKYITTHFNHTYCPDEMVFQSMCWNSPFRKNIYDIESEFRGCLRYIPWENGAIRPFIEKDFRSMSTSDALFGRKFTYDDIIRLHQ